MIRYLIRHLSPEARCLKIQILKTTLKYRLVRANCVAVSLQLAGEKYSDVEDMWDKLFKNGPSKICGR